MHFAGIDVGSKTHVVAIVDESGVIVLKPTTFADSAAGYAKAFALLGSPQDTLVAMEATGHYGRNLRRILSARAFPVAVVNPVRTRRFAEEDLARAKTDSIDSLGIARFAAQKRPSPTPSSPEIDELRETVRLYERVTQDQGDRLRQLHRMVDLCFPEFRQHVRTLDSRRATAILHAYPTATAFAAARTADLCALRQGGRRVVAADVAQRLLEAAGHSIGQHDGDAFRNEVRYLCEDVDRLRRKREELEADLTAWIANNRLGTLLRSIKGLAPLSIARILATAGDPGQQPGIQCLRRSRTGNLPLRPAAPSCADVAPRQRSPSPRSVHDHARRRPVQSVAAQLLRAFEAARKTPQGRAHGVHAEAPLGCLQRGQERLSLRSSCPPAMSTRRTTAETLPSRLHVTVPSTGDAADEAERNGASQLIARLNGKRSPAAIHSTASAPRRPASGPRS